LKRIVVLSSYGIALRARKGMFQVCEKDKKKEISPVEVEAIVIANRAVSITSSAVMLAAKHGIDLVFLDGWNPMARLLPSTYGSTLKTWIAQIVASKRRRLEFAKAFAEGKVYNQRNVLYQLSRKYSRMGGKYRSVRAVIRQAIDSATLALRDIKEAQNVKEVRSAEAHAAKEYWEAVASVLPEELGFKRRLKRYSLPKDEEPDPFNKALNIGYAALLREVWRAIFLTGLNPYYGFLHVKRPGRMSLVLDLMEEFRSIAVDRPLITLSLKDKDVIVGLERDSKEAVAKVWGVVIDVLNNPPRPLKELVLSQARRLARSILERKPYTPYKSTW